VKSGVVLMRFTYTPRRKTNYGLTARYARRQVAAEFAPWLQFTNTSASDTGTQLSLDQGSLTLNSNSDFGHTFQLATTLTAFYGGTRPDDRIDTGNPFAVVHRNLSYVGGEGVIEGVVRPIDELRVVIAAEASVDDEHLGAPQFLDRSNNDPIASATRAEDVDPMLTNVAGRVQMTWDLVPDYLVPTGGLRLDHNSVYGDRLSGHLAVVSRVYTDLYLKAAYGTAFKAATPLLLYGSPLAPGDVIGSPQLAPQELRSAELTVDYQKKGAVESELSVSRWELVDRAVFRAEDINLVARNSADATGLSLEASATSDFSDYIGASLGAELVRVTRQSDEVGYRAQLLGAAQEIYPAYIGRGRLWGRPGPAPIELWVSSRYVGPRNASDSNTLEAGQRYRLPSYVVMDAGVRTLDLRFFGNRLTEFSFRGQNVLDSAEADPGFFGIDYPALGPRLTLQVRQEL
jgi:iron complex outermembrane receptor protein